MTRIIRFPGVMNVSPNHPKFVIPMIADDFNRANGALKGSKTVLGDRVWSAPDNTMIVNNQLSMAGSTASAQATVNTGMTNFEIQAELAAIASTPQNSGGGLMVRNGSNGFNHFSTRVSGSVAGYSFYQNYAGANTAIGNSYLVPPKAGDILKVRVEGSTLKGYVNGILVCTATTPILDGQIAGFLVHPNGTSTIWENFSISKLTID